MSCFSVAMAAAALDDCGCSEEVNVFAWLASDGDDWAVDEEVINTGRGLAELEAVHMPPVGAIRMGCSEAVVAVATGEVTLLAVVGGVEERSRVGVPPVDN